MSGSASGIAVVLAVGLAGCAHSLAAEVAGPHGARQGLGSPTSPDALQDRREAPAIAHLRERCDGALQDLRGRAETTTRTRHYRLAAEVLDGDDFDALCDGIAWCLGDSSGRTFQNWCQAETIGDDAMSDELVVFVRIEIRDQGDPDAHSALPPDPSTWIAVTDADGAKCEILSATAPGAPAVLSPLAPIVTVGVVARRAPVLHEPLRVAVSIGQDGTVQLATTIACVDVGTRRALREAFQAARAQAPPG